MTRIARVRLVPGSCRRPLRLPVRNPTHSVGLSDQKSLKRFLIPAMFPGFPLNEDLFKLIIRRYSDENGAFKTLDKDNSGTIDLDIKESEHQVKCVRILTDCLCLTVASADDVLMKQQRENFFSFYLDVISMSFFKRDQQKVSTGTKEERLLQLCNSAARWRYNISVALIFLFDLKDFHLY
ncbi:hypothetical protein GOODEAATRI_018728 [Goodea atripinnis]|uniref:EF-hand domain-containing protein n=1 Tax=Goodea atripinnis TaxID=208336 RepID=A0ABV0N2I7_9TELE